MAKCKARIFMAVLPGILAGGAAHATEEAAELARRFCAILGAGDDAGLRDLMSASLGDIVDDAQARNAAIVADAGPQAAPLADGMPYKSMAEPARCIPAEISISANMTIVGLDYLVDGGQFWTDRLVLTRESGTLRIDDILFASFPTDTYKAGLRRVLADTFDQ